MDKDYPTVSIDVTVAPQLPTVIEWKTLQCTLKQVYKAQFNIDDLTLVEVDKTRQVILANFIELEKVYMFTLDIDNPPNKALSIALYQLPTRGEIPGHYEELILDYPSGSYSTDEISNIVKKWQSVGHRYLLSSTVGTRTKYDLELMVALASAIALLCDGVIILDSFGFSATYGLFTPQEFLSVSPLKP